MPKRKVNLGGKEYTAEVLEFETLREGWNSYALEDGTELKLKAVVTDIVRLDGAYAPNGDPLYMVQSSNIVATNVPEGLKRQPPTGE